MRKKTDYSHQKQYKQFKHLQNKITSKQKWEEKQLYGHFKRQTGGKKLTRKLGHS